MAAFLVRLLGENYRERATVWTVALACLLFFLTASSTVNSVYVFRTDAASPLHVSGFYPPSKYTTPSFRGGAVLTALDQALFEAQPQVENRIGGQTVALYLLKSESPLCGQYKDLCWREKEDTLGLAVTQPDGSVTLTTSYTWLTPRNVPLQDGLRLESVGAQSLFVVPVHWQHWPVILGAEGRDGDRFDFDLSALRYVDLWIVPYILLVGALAGLIVWLALSQPFIDFMRHTLSANPYASSVLVGWAFVCYLSVFPGIFSSDTLFGAANESSFSDWYGTTYFIYTVLFRVVGNSLIQLPPILCFAFSFLIILRLIDLVFGEAVRKARVIKLVFLTGVLTSPAIFAAMFVQQRYFLAASIFALALALGALTWVHQQRKPKADSAYDAILPYIPVAGLLALAAFLRADYTVFFLALLGALLFLAISKPEEHRRAYGALGVTLVFFFVIGSILTQTIPAVYQAPVELNQARYKSVTTLKWAAPYVTCDDGEINGPLEPYIEKLGGMDAYCQHSPEEFWWLHGYGNSPSVGAEELERFSGAVIGAMLNNPVPYVHERLALAGDLLTQKYWHIVSHFKRRDAALNGNATLSTHEYHADRFGLVLDSAIIEPLNRTIPRFYAGLSRVPGGFTMLAMVVIVGVTVYLAFATRAYATVAMSALVIGLCIPVLALTPVPTWAYLVFVPIWMSYVIPIGLCERAIRSQTPSKFH